METSSYRTLASGLSGPRVAISSCIPCFVDLLVVKFARKLRRSPPMGPQKSRIFSDDQRQCCRDLLLLSHEARRIFGIQCAGQADGPLLEKRGTCAPPRQHFQRPLFPAFPGSPLRPVRERREIPAAGWRSVASAPAVLREEESSDPVALRSLSKELASRNSAEARTEAAPHIRYAKCSRACFAPTRSPAA